MHEIPFLTGIGVSESIAALTLTGITMSSIVGRLGFAVLGDIYDKKKLLVIAFIVKSIGVFFFANIRSPWMIIPFLIFYGPGFGAPMPLVPAIQADCFGTRSFATVRGLMAISQTISGVIGPIFAGWIYDVVGNYYLAFTIFAIVCSLSVPTAMFLKLTPVAERVAARKKTPG